MKKRVISAAVLLAIIIPLIIIGKIPFALAVGVIGLFAYKEIMDLNKYPLMVKVLGIISLISIVYSNFDSKMINFGLDFKIISISFLLLFIPVIFYQVNNKYTVDDAFRLFGFLFLIGVSLNYFIIIRDMDLKYFILMLLTPMLTDTFAYICGSLIGKHKVTKLSPHKSWEGYIIGSLMGTFIMTMYYVTVIGNQSNIFIVIGIILLMTIIGQIGDLFFSAIKRHYDIKDFSNLIPGHGGILDRLDSLSFVAIVFIIFMSYL